MPEPRVLHRDIDGLPTIVFDPETNRVVFKIMTAYGDHTCTTCELTIPRGSPYARARRQRYSTRGQLFTPQLKCHWECLPQCCTRIVAVFSRNHASTQPPTAREQMEQLSIATGAAQRVIYGFNIAMTNAYQSIPNVTMGARE